MAMLIFCVLQNFQEKLIFGSNFDKNGSELVFSLYFYSVCQKIKLPRIISKVVLICLEFCQFFLRFFIFGSIFGDVATDTMLKVVRF